MLHLMRAAVPSIPAKILNEWIQRTAWGHLMAGQYSGLCQWPASDVVTVQWPVPGRIHWHTGHTTALWRCAAPQSLGLSLCIITVATGINQAYFLIMLKYVWNITRQEMIWQQASMSELYAVAKIFYLNLSY